MSSSKLLIIDTRVQDYNVFITSKQEDVLYVTLDYNTDTYASLTERIVSELNGNSLESVALVSHAVNGSEFKLLDNESGAVLLGVQESDASLNTWSGFRDFWTGIGATTIDLLGCALYIDDDWRYILDSLEEQMGVNFRASVDDTGALAIGANWVLESDNVNAKDVYFTEAIEDWLGKLLYFGINVFLPIHGAQVQNIIIDSSGSAFASGLGKYVNGGVTVNSTYLGTQATTTTAYNSFTGLNTSSALITENRQIVSACNARNVSAYVDMSGLVFTCGERFVYSNPQPYSYLGYTHSSTVVPLTNPTLVSSISNEVIVQVSCGNQYLLYLTNDGRVYGSGILYMVGDFNALPQPKLYTSNTVTPVLLTQFTGKKIVRLEAASNLSYFLDSSGNVYDRNCNRILGDISNTRIKSFSVAGNEIGVIDSGGDSIAFLDYSGNVYFMGQNTNNKFGITTPSSYALPTRATHLSNVHAISIGSIHSIYLHKDGSIYTCGRAYLNCRTTDSATFQKVTFNNGIIAGIGAYGDYTQIITTSGAVYNCGDISGSGNLGSGSGTLRTSTLTQRASTLGSTRFIGMNNTDSLSYRVQPELSGNITTLTTLYFGQTTSNLNIAGTFRDPTTKVPLAGTLSYDNTTVSSSSTQNWTFYPDDTTNYVPTTGSVYITVSKTTPSVSGTLSASSIFYGQFLSSSTISGTFNNPYNSASVAGALSYDLSGTTKPSTTGSISYPWTFKVTDTTNYTDASGNLAVVVNKTTPSITSTLSASSLVYGQSLSSSTITGSFRNQYDLVTVGGSNSFDSSATTIPSVGTTSYPWTFRPTNTTLYNTSTGNLSVTTTKATPCGSLVTVSATDISFGQTLASSVLSYTGNFRNINSGETVSGTIVFSTPSTKPNAISTVSYQWTFMPDASNNYNSINGNVNVRTIKTTPDVSGVLSSGAITYGQSLSSATITGSMKNPYDASNVSVAGSFTYDLSSSIPSAGTASYAWTFRPTSSSFYNNANGNINVSVSQKRPDISGTQTASSIFFGQTLSSSNISGLMRNSLNGATVDGSFNFASPSTKPISVSTSSYQWAFIPSNTNNYTSDASGSVSVTVNKTTPCGSQITVSATNISYGQSIASSTISYTGDVINPYDSSIIPGTIAFTTPSTTPSSVGTASYGWTFTPSDLSNNNTIQGTVNVTTIAITPVFSYSSRDISYNTASFISPSITTTGDGGSLTYDISGTVPTGISINSTTGSVSWNTGIPVGNYSIVIKATNTSGLVGTAAFAYNILPVKAVFGYTTQTVSFDTSGNVSPSVSYDGGDSSIVYSLARSLPSNSLSFNTTTGVISWSSGILVGTYTVDVSGANSSGSVHGSSFTLVVQCVQPDIEYVPDAMSVSYDTSGEILPTIVYSGGDTSLDYDISGQLSTNDISLNRTTGRIFWLKGIATGSYPITVKGITDNNLFDSDIFTLTVNPVKAIFHYANATINYDVSYTATPIVDYTGGDSSIIYDLSNNLPEPSYMSFSNGVISVVEGIPVGSYTISIKGRNQSNQYHYTQFTIDVVAVSPSALTYSTTTTTISYGVSSEILLSSIYTGGDSQLTFDISGNAPGNVQVNSSNGRIQIAGLSAGTYHIPIRASNSAGRTSTTITVVIQKTSPTIKNAISATTITYGQRLTSSDLSGQHENPHTNASVGGLYSFRSPNMLLNAGSQSVTWDFAPSDSSNYSDISGSVSVTINKKTPDVSNAISVSTIEYGQTLDNATFNGAFYNSYNDAAVNGSFGFDLSSNRPSAGSHSYNWVFKPVASSNYNDISGPISITVNKATPDISGSVSLLNNISYGQLLSSSSISGLFKNPHSHTSVAGTIFFDLSSSVPNAGTASYAWTFIPSDTANYHSKSGNISVTVDYASNSTNIKNIIDDVSSNVLDISVNETIFDISSYITNSLFSNPASRVVSSKIYKSRFMYSYAPTQLSQGAIITTNAYNDNPYTLEMTDISDVYNVIVTAVPTPYVISPLTNLTTEFAFTYKVIDTLTGQFVSNLSKTISAIVDLSGSYNSNRTYKIYHVDTSSGVYTELTKNISNNKVNFQITKNNMIIGGSQVNTPPPSTTAYATITLPFIFDISASNVIVYGEDLSSGLITADYSVGDTTGSLSASSMRDALVYRDSSYNDWSNNDVIIGDASGVALAINKLVDTTILDIGPQGSATYANSKYPYSPSPLSSHFIQYIASVLFGHPQAQAPIKNDLSVMDELYNCNMGGQFVGPSGLGDPTVRRLIFEQMVGSVPERFGIQDTDSPYKPLPFQTGDTIFFRVKMAGNLLTDSTSHIQGATPVDLTKLFAQQIQSGYIDGATLKMNPKVWKIKLVLG